MSAIKQLFREFWLPLVLALLWALYNLKIHAGGSWDFTRFLNIFGPTFVFTSYLLAQWFRVRKQQKVESGLRTIESNVSQLVRDLDKRTKDLIGHVTGGDSFCHLVGGHITPENQVLNLCLHHDSEHQLYDMHVRIVDLQVFEQEISRKPENLRKADTVFYLDSFLPGYGHPLYSKDKAGERAMLDLGDGDKAGFNIFFTARNGAFFQYLRFARVAGKWTKASHVSRNDEILLEVIDADFPRSDNGQIIWDEPRPPGQAEQRGCSNRA